MTLRKKTLIKEKKNRNSNLQNKNKTHKKNKKNNIKNLHLIGGARDNNINKSPESNNFNPAQLTEDDFNNNNNNISQEGDKKQQQNIVEEEPAVGTYNNPERTKELSTIEKKQIEGRSGLTVQYPPIINTTKEEAMEAKLKNTREPGFTNYWEQMEDTLTQKFLVSQFYPKYLISSSSGSNSNTNSNNFGNNYNTNDLMNNNNLGNNFNLNEKEK
jgi:hypothetical protein